jgi:YD repeat-containing protein
MISLDQRTSAKDPKGNMTTYQYDTLNRLIATIQPGNVTTLRQHIAGKCIGPDAGQCQHMTKRTGIRDCRGFIVKNNQSISLYSLFSSKIHRPIRRRARAFSIVVE